MKDLSGLCPHCGKRVITRAFMVDLMSGKFCLKVSIPSVSQGSYQGEPTCLDDGQNQPEASGDKGGG